MARPAPHIPALLEGLLLVLVLLGGGCDFQDSPPRTQQGTDSTIFVNSVGMEFRRIPAGTFEMGSTRGEDDEAPPHDVSISEPFYMGAHEVTQLQWNALMDDTLSQFRGIHRPVENVSWYQARAFVDSLNAEEETDLYRLPTEAEWEYAARGGTHTRFYFGTAWDSLSNHAWYSSNSEGRTHRVAEKHSNPFGLHDVYGNVWEWVRDAYSPRYYARSGRRDPLNTGRGRVPRVIRGGGWFGVRSSLRSANRGWARPGSRAPQLGFRVVREIPDDKQ
ncbi:MAG: formylglycine-generating enzyme family protein [Salinibacter sp.]